MSINIMMPTYQVCQVHNHTRQRVTWPATFTSVDEFAAEVFEYLNSRDSYLAIGRKLYQCGQVEDETGKGEWIPHSSPVIDLDDPQDFYSPFFHDYTYEMTPKEVKSGL